MSWGVRSGRGYGKEPHSRSGPNVDLSSLLQTTGVIVDLIDLLAHRCRYHFSLELGMENAQIANIFDEIARLLELQGADQFRIRAYYAAARTIRDLSRRLADMVAANEDLTELTGIGKSTAEKIKEIVATGACERLKELLREVPSGLPEVMRVEGVGPKKAMKLYKALGVHSLEALKQAAQAGKIRKLPGFGTKSEEKIFQAIGNLSQSAGRVLYSEAAGYVESLRAHLDCLGDVKRWEPAGSFRRTMETVGDLDMVVLADDRGKACQQIRSYAAIADVLSEGIEKLTVRIAGGLQVDFRFFQAEEFGSAMMYFTGSKAHNIALRRIAQERGWKLNEYGLFEGDRRLAGGDEEGIYRRLGLPWICPELREDRGEIQAAQEGKLPALVEAGDIRGDLHAHTVATDGKNTMAEMADAARRRGLGFLAITDHSQRVTMAGGLNDDACRRQADEVRRVAAGLKKFWLMAGIEVDILKDGKLDLKEKTLAGLDWVVASVHYDRKMERGPMTERILRAVRSGVVHCLGHPLGRILRQREPIAFDAEKVFAACAECHVAVEINAQPDRLDLPDTHCRQAAEAGVKFALGTDAHRVEELGFMKYALNVARRGWLQEKDLVNAMPIASLRRWARRQS